jgi:ribosomal protein S18 acetylase RimI-like enzyme
MWRSVAVTGDSYYSPLAIFLRDERAAILGGAGGYVWGGWLDPSLRRVAKPRSGQGYGKKLLESLRG